MGRQLLAYVIAGAAVETGLLLHFVRTALFGTDYIELEGYIISVTVTVAAIVAVVLTVLTLRRG